jgi:hypothetical protein
VTEGTLTNSPTGAGDAGSTLNGVESQPKTVEEVEAFWRNRFSARDKAHNAETAALKAQMEAMQKAPAKAQEGESPEAARVRELEAALEAERRARAVTSLAAKYPDAAAVLGDQIATLPEEKIAAIDAVAAGGSGGPIIDANAAPRRASAAPVAKPVEEKSVEELKDELRALTPAYKQMLSEK